MLSDTQSSQSKVKLLPTLSRLCLTQCKASPEVTAQGPALLNYYSSHFSHPFPTSLLHTQIYIYIYSFTSAQILWSFKSQFCILSTLLQPPSHVRASFPSSCSCIPILTFSVTPNTPKIRWEVPFNFSPPLIGTSLCYMITGCQD